jgi:hypothetical protein
LSQTNDPPASGFPSAEITSLYHHTWLVHLFLTALKLFASETNTSNESLWKTQNPYLIQITMAQVVECLPSETLGSNPSAAKTKQNKTHTQKNNSLSGWWSGLNG